MAPVALKYMHELIFLSFHLDCKHFSFCPANAVTSRLAKQLAFQKPSYYCYLPSFMQPEVCETVISRILEPAAHSVVTDTSIPFRSGESNFTGCGVEWSKQLISFLLITVPH